MARGADGRGDYREGVAHRSDPHLLVLHGLRLKGFAEPDAVAAATGLAVDDVGRLLEHAGADGLAVHREGRISGWSLTPAGRARHAELLADEAATAGCAGLVSDVYDRFLKLNDVFKEVCTAWQVRDLDANVVNDHSDAEYDAGVVGRLGDVHRGTTPLCAELAEALARFAPYGDRFERAHEQVVGGVHEWFAKPLIDSYHTVWMELHEDLLATLGRKRDEKDGS